MEEETATDYEGLFALTPNLVNQLQDFLQRKEADLADYIQQTFLPSPGTYHIPFINTHTSDFKLSEVIPSIEQMTQRLYETQPIQDRQRHWRELRNNINKRLWNYVETLEGASTELYEELALVGFDRWRTELFENLKKMNDDLLRRVADLKIIIPKLEQILWDYRSAKDGKGFHRGILDRFQFWFTDTLDKELKTNVDKTEQFLKLKFKDFSDKFDAYCKVDPIVSDTLDRCGDYIIIKKMERSSQDRIVLLEVLLNCWEAAKNKYKILHEDIARSIYQSVNINRVPALFREYSGAIKKALFETGRSFKSGDLFALKPMLEDGIALIRKELKAFKSSAGLYREFIQNKDSTQANELVHIIYELQHLDQLYERLSASLARFDDPEQGPYKESLHKEIEGILHTMGQPLISRKAMRSQTHNLVPRLQDCDELGSPQESILDFMSEMLNKALRLDWKYQTLQEIPGFHEIVAYHLGLLGPIPDRSHINRYGKFKKIIQHIEHWVKGGKTYRHVDEIELDMNDIKEYLQDFLASIQRSIRETPQNDKESLLERWETYSQMLLEYRYLFANFFNVLRQQGDEGEYIRNQFQYIDRYFDAIEMQLKNLKESIGEVKGSRFIEEEDDDLTDLSDEHTTEEE